MYSKMYGKKYVLLTYIQNRVKVIKWKGIPKQVIAKVDRAFSIWLQRGSCFLYNLLILEPSTWRSRKNSWPICMKNSQCTKEIQYPGYKPCQRALVRTVPNCACICLFFLFLSSVKSLGLQMFQQIQRLSATWVLMFQLSPLTLKAGVKQKPFISVTSTLLKLQVIELSLFTTFLLGLQVIPEARMLIIPRLQALMYFSSIQVMQTTMQNNLQSRPYSSNSCQRTRSMWKWEVAKYAMILKRKTPPSRSTAGRVLGIFWQSPRRWRQLSQSTYSQTGPTRQAGKKLTYPIQVTQLGYSTTLLCF